MIKRIFDVAAALALIVVLAPFFLIAAILIKSTSPGPAIFKQKRIGRNGVVFDICKFRTMIDGAADIGSGLKTAENDFRITPVGAWLRRYSLDELPQLFNILKGEMSFIGPRPVPEIHARSYDIKNPKRLSLRPGITGWAQISGRNNLDWPQKIQKDIEYADNISFLLDLKIILKTIIYVFGGKNLYSERFAAEVDAHNQAWLSRPARGKEKQNDPER